jgi:hypothetical protein
MATEHMTPDPRADLAAIIETMRLPIRLSNREAGIIADAILKAGWTPPTTDDEPLAEWCCPNCGATTRARMADRPTTTDDRPGIAALIEASSLGTPEAKALRESVSLERAQAIVARANDLAAMSDDDWHAAQSPGYDWSHPVVDSELLPTADDVLALVESRRQDTAFMERLRDSVERHRPILDRLAAPPYQTNPDDSDLARRAGYAEVVDYLTDQRDAARAELDALKARIEALIDAAERETDDGGDKVVYVSDLRAALTPAGTPR